MFAYKAPNSRCCSKCKASILLGDLAYRDLLKGTDFCYDCHDPNPPEDFCSSCDGSGCNACQEVYSRKEL